MQVLLNTPEEAALAIEQTCAVAGMLRPDLLTAEGREPELRVVYHGLSWQRYLMLDQILGDDRAVPRMYYLDGTLEIMTTSNEHEHVKKWLGTLLEIYLEEKTDFKIALRGQATMRLELKKAGAEPDESYCFGGEKKFPDLVLEIALTSGGVKKLELYRRFAVPEVWFWRKGKLEIHALLPDGSGYEQLLDGSRLLPELDAALLERCVVIDDWRVARKTFRDGLKS